MTCKFECFQSHCRILKEFYEFLCMMDASIIFGEGSFRYIYIYILGKLWIGHKVIWGCMCNLGGNRRKNKMSSDESSHLVSRGAKSLEATILYNDSQHNILALQGRAKN